MKLLAILSFMVLHSVAQAFTVTRSYVPTAASASASTSTSSTTFKYTSRTTRTFDTHLLASNDNDNDNGNDNGNDIDESSNDYPLDLPSPVLLASSMVIAIASTGSIFELSGGSPVIGVVPSVAIAVAGIPTCLFLFYAAIKKGIAETEADDAEFQNQRRNTKF